MDNFCAASRAVRTFDGMTEIAVSPEDVARMGDSLVEVSTVIGDLSLLGPEAGWLPAGPALDAFTEVVTTWERLRIQLEQSVGALGESARTAGGLYIDAEELTIATLGPGGDTG